MTNVLFILFFLVSGLSIPAAARQWPYPSAAVEPAIEAAVAIQMLAEDPVITFNDTSYARRMRAHFEPYKHHAAVRYYSETFLNKPVDFWDVVLTASGNFPKLRPRQEIHGKLFEHLASFYHDTQFMKFFNENRSHYQRCVLAFLEQMKGRDYAEFLEKYTRMPVVAQYKVLISPALATMGMHFSSDGVVTVMGAEMGVTEDRPFFSYPSFAAHMIHQLSHVLVAPLASEHLEELSTTSACYGAVARVCRKNWTDCLNEHLAKAVSLGAGKLVPHSADNAAFFERLEEENRGPQTPYLSTLSKALEDFEKNSKRYPTLADFYPKLLSALQPCPKLTGASDAEPPSAPWRYYEHLQMGRRYYLQENNPGKALKIFNSLTRDFSNETFLWIEQAKVAMLLGQKEEAKKSLIAAQALHPETAQLHEIALIYQQAQEYPTSLALFDALLKKDPKNAVYLKDRGICKFLMGRGEDASQDLEASLRISPLPSASLTLGSLYEGRGRIQEALQTYEKALSRKEPLSAEEAAVLNLIKNQRSKLIRSP